MRIRRLVAVSLLALGTVVTVPGVAHASGSAGEISECLLEKAEELEAGKIDAGEFDVEAKNCYAAPSPLLPATGEIIWGGIAFLIVAFGLIKFGFPALRKGLADREAKIREDLEAAEAAKAAVADAGSKNEQVIAEANAKAAGIIDEARKSAETVRADLIARAEADAADIRARANADAAMATERAMAELQSQVATLSVDLAERVVQRNLDRDTQRALVESFIDEVGRS